MEEGTVVWRDEECAQAVYKLLDEYEIEIKRVMSYYLPNGVSVKLTCEAWAE